MPDPTLKIDSTTVLSKSGTTVSVDSGLNIKPAFSALDSSASNGPTSGTAVTKSTTLPIFGCRAWVNFDGRSASTTSISGEDCCAIRASGNVSKVVRNGAGDYTITFTTAMPDANYVIASIGTDSANYYTTIADSDAAPSAGSIRVSSRAGGATGPKNDTTYGHYIVVR